MRPTDHLYTEIQGETREQLKGRFTAEQERAKDLVKILASYRQQSGSDEEAPMLTVETSYL